MRKAIVQCVCMRGTVSRKLVCGRLSQKSRVEITMNLREGGMEEGREGEREEGREGEKKGGREEGERREGGKGREGEEREGGKKEGSINITIAILVMSTSLLSAMSILNCLLSSDTASFQLFSPPHTYTPPTEFYNTHTYTPLIYNIHTHHSQNYNTHTRVF